MVTKRKSGEEPARKAKKKRKPAELECDQCDKVYTRSNKLKEHKKNKHQGDGKIPDKPFKCIPCNQSFVRKSNLNAHQRNPNCKNQSVEKTTYPCEKCGFTFTTPFNLRRHQNKKNNKECFKKQQLGTQDGPSACPYCGASLCSTYYLHLHMGNHWCRRNQDMGKCGIERKYKCNECPCEFAEEGHLKLHKFRIVCERINRERELRRKRNRRIDADNAKDKPRPASNRSVKRSTRKQNVPLIVQFPCRICEATLTRRNDMADHVEATHNLSIPRDQLESLEDFILEFDLDRPKLFCCYVCLQTFCSICAAYICVQDCEEKFNLVR